jgi:Predicted periplasmic protein
MKRNNVLRLILDFIIAILILLEINYNFIGGKLHEIIGLVIGVLVLSHCVINKRWFISIFSRKKEHTISHSFRLIINLLLIISFIVLILSGILISGYVFKLTTISNPRMWSEIHHMMAKVCGILLIIHVMMHGKYMITLFIKGRKEKKAIIGIGAFLVIVAIAFGVVNSRREEQNEIFGQSKNIAENSSNLDSTKSIGESIEENSEKSSVADGNKNSQGAEISANTNAGEMNNKNTAEEIKQKDDNRSEQVDNTTPSQKPAEKSKVSSSNTNGIQKAEKLTLTFNYNRAGTPASNQYAIWIEDSGGNLVKTLYASDFTANGGYKFRTDSLKAWVHKSNLASMPSGEVDAISGATPRAGKQTYIWDGTDDAGNQVSNGEYRFYLEGTLYWSSSVLFSGSVNIGGGSQSSIQVNSNYTEDTDTNRNMISGVAATYKVD